MAKKQVKEDILSKETKEEALAVDAKTDIHEITPASETKVAKDSLDEETNEEDRR